MIPRIDPVSPGLPRPLWSVMIPTYNVNRGYLRATLESVLAQDPGPDRMQIEVVDNCSTTGDPQELVNELGRGRILFHRNSQNEGLFGNLNKCIQRSKGRLVHILHADDYVILRFYERVLREFKKRPRVNAVFSLTFIIDGDENLLEISRSCPLLQRNPEDPRDLMVSNPLRCPGVVVRRAFYERYGGFETELPHVGDWEMWVRAIVHGGARILDEPLAYYREHSGNDTTRLVRTAENIQDAFRLSAKWESDGLPYFNRAAFDQRAARLAFLQAVQFVVRGEREAAAANFGLWRERLRISPYPIVLEALLLGVWVAAMAIRRLTIRGPRSVVPGSLGRRAAARIERRPTHQRPRPDSAR